MKHHRFFIREKINIKSPEITLLDPSITHQMKNVLRLRKGSDVILLDGTGLEFHGRVRILTKKEVVIARNLSEEKIIKDSKLNEANKKENRELELGSRTNKIKINLFVSLIKKDKFEWVLQKVTELGVSRITPIISERTEKQKINMERADKIVREASEQSERVDFPFVDEPISLKEAISICETDSEPIVLDLKGEMINVTQLRQINSDNSEQAKEIYIFVGPEGGWSQKDFEEFEKIKYKKVTLGKQVLRAETASVAICSLLLLG